MNSSYICTLKISYFSSHEVSDIECSFVSNDCYVPNLRKSRSCTEKSKDLTIERVGRALPKAID